MGALFKMSAKMTRFSKLGIFLRKLGVLASATCFVFYGHLYTMHFVQEQKKKHLISSNGHWLRRAPPFCFVWLLCNVLFQTESQLQTQLQSATKRFLVTYCCIAKCNEALCNACLMQLTLAHLLDIAHLLECRLILPLYYVAYDDVVMQWRRAKPCHTYW